MAVAAQQPTLSVRISDSLRQRLERARRLAASKTGEAVSTSEIAKRLLESARDDRLEVVDLLEEPTQALLDIRLKAEARQGLSRSEWVLIAHFVQQGLELAPGAASNPVSRESLVAVLDASLALLDLRTDRESRLNAYYLGNLPPEFRAAASKRGDRSSDAVTADLVRRTVAAARKHVSDPATTWVPNLIGRNLYTLLDEDKLPGSEAISSALRPFWPVLWRLAARGHFGVTGGAVRSETAKLVGLYQPPIPSLSEGAFELSFARGEGREFSVLLSCRGQRGPRYPIVGYPRIAEFRTMVESLAADQEPGDWTGAYFFAEILADKSNGASEIWFRAHGNGIAVGFSIDEWTSVHSLFRRAWEQSEIRRAWDTLGLEYGEL